MMTLLTDGQNDGQYEFALAFVVMGENGTELGEKEHQAGMIRYPVASEGVMTCAVVKKLCTFWSLGVPCARV